MLLVLVVVVVVLIILKFSKTEQIAVDFPFYVY